MISFESVERDERGSPRFLHIYTGIFPVFWHSSGAGGRSRREG